MDVREIENLKNAVEAIEESLGDLKTKAAVICDTIDSKELVPANTADELTLALESYRRQERRLRDLGAELSINFGTKLSDIYSAIRDFEEKQSVDRLREIVLDYFRLNTEAADIKEHLEQSKLVLVGKCVASTGQLSESLAPYEVVVSSVKSGKAQLPFCDYERVANEINKGVAYATVCGQIYLDNSTDLSIYADGSSPLSAIPENAVQETNSDAASADDKADAEAEVPESEPQAAEESQPLRRWNGFGGYVPEDAAVVVSDKKGKPTLEEIKGLEKQNPDCLAVLWNAANEKLIPAHGAAGSESRVLSRAAIELLHSNGYLANIQISDDSEAEAYLTLSSKGWESFAKSDVKNYLAKQKVPLIIPNKLCISCDEWTPLFAVRAALLSDYCRRNGRSYVLWRADASEAAVAMPTEQPDIVILAGLFREKTEENDLKEMAAALKSHADNAAALIVVRQNTDIDILKTELAALLSSKKEVRFAVAGKDYPITDDKRQLREPPRKPEKPDAAAENASTSETTPEPETSEAAEPAMLTALNSVKTNAAGASKFKGDIKNLARQNREIYAILPLLLNLGVLEREQIYEFGVCLGDFNEDDVSREKVMGAVDLLSSKGMLANYRLPINGDSLDVYGLSSYCCGSMRKKEVASLYALPFYRCSRSIACGKTIELDTVERTVAANTALLQYLYAAKAQFSEYEYSGVMKSIIWVDSYYSVDCFHDGEKFLSCLLTKNISIEGAAADAVLLCGSCVQKAEKCAKQFSRVFVVHDNSISLWGAEPETINGEAFPEAEAVVMEIAEAAAPEADKSALDEPTSLPDSGDRKRVTEGLDKQTPPEAFGITAEMTPTEAAAVILEQRVEPQYFAVYQALILKLISHNKSMFNDGAAESGIAQALLLARTLSGYHQDYSRLCEQLATALDSDIAEHHYTCKRISSLFNDETQGSVLHLLSIIRALFASENAYDYELISYAKSYFEAFDAFFAPYGSFKPLYKTLLDLADTTPSGFSATVLRNFIDNEKYVQNLKSVTTAAQRFRSEPKINKPLKGVPQMLRLCFGSKSDLGECMKIIAENDSSQKDLVMLLLKDVFCGKDSGEIDEDSVSEFIDQKWKEATADIRTVKEVNYEVRSRLTSLIHERLEVIKSWLSMIDSYTNTYSIENLKKYYSQVKKLIETTKSELVPPGYEAAAAAHCLTNMERILRGEAGFDAMIFRDVLRTGYFALDETKHIPIINDSLPVVNYFEPWTNAMRHIAAPTLTFDEILDLISGGDEPEYRDNIGQALSICELRGFDVREAEFLADIDSAAKTAKQSVETFNGELELAFAYGRIDETIKEDIAETIILFYPHFESTRNYGTLNTFLAALRKAVEDATMKGSADIERDISERWSDELSPEKLHLLDAARKKISKPERNFVVAEEYINRFDAGTLDSSLLVDAYDTSAFLQFVSKEVYSKLYDYCARNKDRALRTFGGEYVNNRLQKQGLSAQYLRSAKQLLQSMPNQADSNDDTNPDKIVTLLKELGFGAKKASRRRIGGNILSYLVDVDPDEPGRSEYAHPIAEMGTKIKPKIEVLFLFGQKQANDIVDRICNIELNEHALVFLNGALDLPSRRQIAERFHREKSGRNPFLLIDWVLLLHLASFPQSERLSIMLNCTMPYTSSFNPFVKTSAMPLPDEMYIGRKRELNQITDPNGPVLLYGGRQLGKTALLEKAASLKNKPEKKEYGIKIQLGGVGDESIAVERIRDELMRVGVRVRACDSIRELCRELRRLYDKNEWLRLFIFIDEADAILTAFRRQTPAYDSIIALSELMKNTQGCFKFVLAGLHDVCRAANDPNTIFGQLGKPLVIEPLKPADALELLSRPLRYLGFKLNSDELEVMLINTSFYPGIIHFVGYNLVENLSNKYGEYYSANNGNPPYELTEKQLGDIMSANSINVEINQRIRWTLDVDKRYFSIARCIAYLYLDCPENNKNGHSIDSIREYGELLGISNLSGLSKAEFETLLLELEKMWILVRPTDTTYRLRQRRFLDAIGNTREKIESDIIDAEENNEQG